MNELTIEEPAHGRVITIRDDGTVELNRPEDRAALAAKNMDISSQDLRAVHEWLAIDAPGALVRVNGAIAPGHPLGLPAAPPYR